MKHDLSGTAQDQTHSYTRNQVGEIAGHSWSNDAYQWAGVAGNAVNGSKSYTANGLNQYTAVTNITPSYDTNGNFKGDGTWSYGYGAFGSELGRPTSGYRLSGATCNGADGAGPRLRLY